ncbi:hypothetical protein [Streptomyces lydicus]|uniref:hypothetical protein n=1 Tax=Streptomyces lydicus TaxID=47763 RepID=UPI003443654C
MRTAQSRDRYRRPLKNSMLALFTAGCATLAVTSCSGGSGGTEAKPSATKASEKPSPTASADPQAAAKKELLGAYDHFWGEQVKAYSKGTEKGTDLEKYASTEALARALGDLASLHGSGNVTSGKPTHDAKVTALGLTKKLPDATITDCMDVSKWRTVNKKTGKALATPKGKLTRYVSIVSAQKWGKQWMITKVEPQHRSC